jgi:hypothetical protein
MGFIVWVRGVASGVESPRQRWGWTGRAGRFSLVAVIEVEVGIYVHVDVQAKRMAHVATITPGLVIRIITGYDVLVLSVVATYRIVVFTRDPNKTTEMGRDDGGVSSDGEKGVLLLVVAFETVEKWEENMVGSM